MNKQKKKVRPHFLDQYCYFFGPPYSVRPIINVHFWDNPKEWKIYECDFCILRKMSFYRALFYFHPFKTTDNILKIVYIRIVRYSLAFLKNPFDELMINSRYLYEYKYHG